MNSRLVRVGTIYLPVTSPKVTADWFCTNLGAELSYLDEENNHAIINLAYQSFILIQSEKGILANFQTINDGLMFPFTFEVDGEFRANYLQSLKKNTVFNNYKVSNG